MSSLDLIRQLPAPALSPGWYYLNLEGQYVPFEPKHNEWPPQTLVFICEKPSSKTQKYI